MTQTQLFAAARRSDPQESHDAAATTNVARSHLIVLDRFQRYGAMCDRQLVALTREWISESMARGARCELARAGQLEVCGTIGTPPRRVWKLKG